MGNCFSSNGIDGGSTITKNATTSAKVTSLPPSHHTESLPDIEVKTVPRSVSPSTVDATNTKSNDKDWSSTKKDSDAAKPKPQRAIKPTSSSNNASAGSDRTISFTGQSALPSTSYTYSYSGGSTSYSGDCSGGSYGGGGGDGGCGGGGGGDGGGCGGGW
ncbi:hypothetical protein BGW41_007447 [Actinomortierella wolfii]|nr:hypothetical protein BGW41_007447 [Actinomortierella wolfii]